jgi:hypothetical protein
MKGHEIRYESGMIEITGPLIWLKAALGPHGSTMDIRLILSSLLDEADKQNEKWQIERELQRMRRMENFDVTETEEDSK